MNFRCRKIGQVGLSKLGPDVLLGVHVVAREATTGIDPGLIGAITGQGQVMQTKKVLCKAGQIAIVGLFR
jgi:hypothetical protein